MDPVCADRPYQTIATDDIGAFVALAFERPQKSLKTLVRPRTETTASAVFGFGAAVGVVVSASGIG